MKSIQLTEKHKSKLLEMCKILFPEQEFYWEYEMYGRGLKEDFNDVLQVYFKDKEAWKSNLFPFNIHWFEFCMTHLIEKLLFINSNNDIFVENSFNKLSLFKGIIFDEDENHNNHPVDYLYEEFIKLK